MVNVNKNLELIEYKEIDDEVIEILASDETVDRDNDIIRAGGWQTEGWLKTGSLLYGHSREDLPVGSAEKAEVRAKKLYLYSKLAKKGTSAWHDTIRSLLEQKVLKGVSVGFKALEYGENEHGGLTFTKQELLEISLTPVPANSNAEVLIKEMGVSDEIKNKLFNEQIKIEEDKVQEETKEVEPEPETLSEREEKFVATVNILKSIIGE